MSISIKLVLANFPVFVGIGMGTCIHFFHGQSTNKTPLSTQHLNWCPYVWWPPKFSIAPRHKGYISSWKSFCKCQEIMDAFVNRWMDQAYVQRCTEILAWGEEVWLLTKDSNLVYYPSKSKPWIIFFYRYLFSSKTYSLSTSGIHGPVDHAHTHTVRTFLDLRKRMDQF